MKLNSNSEISDLCHFHNRITKFKCQLINKNKFLPNYNCSKLLHKTNFIKMKLTPFDQLQPQFHNLRRYLCILSDLFSKLVDFLGAICSLIMQTLAVDQILNFKWNVFNSVTISDIKLLRNEPSFTSRIGRNKRINCLESLDIAIDNF